jgi:predicted membrane channel-forming protein YqfA (hemolysin III family)
MQIIGGIVFYALLTVAGLVLVLLWVPGDTRARIIGVTIYVVLGGIGIFYPEPVKAAHLNGEGLRHLEQYLR